MGYGQERYEARCEICGQTFRSASKEQTVRELQEHAREKHGASLTEQQAKREVHPAA